MPDGVKIPVDVVGAPAAQQQLKATEQAVKGVDAAGKSAAAGNAAQATAASQAAAAQTEAGTAAARAGAQHEEAGKHVRGHEAGHRALVNILGHVNPELGQMAHLLFSIEKVAGGATAALLTMGLTGAAIGGVVVAIDEIVESAKKAREEIERVQKAQEELRDQGVELIAETGKTLAGAGVSPSAAVLNQVIGTITELGKKGTRKDLATSAAVAQQVGGLSSDELETFLAGEVASGRKAIEFTTDQAENKKRIREMMTRGASPEAAQALTDVRSAEMQAALREVPGLGSRVLGGGEISADTFMQRMKKDRPDFDPASEKFLEEVVRKGLTADTEEGREKLLEEINKHRGVLAQEQMGDVRNWGLLAQGIDPMKPGIRDEAQQAEDLRIGLRSLTLSGARRNVGEIMDVAGEFRKAGGGALIGDEPRPASQPSAPIIFNFNNKHVLTSYEMNEANERKRASDDGVSQQMTMFQK